MKKSSTRRARRSIVAFVLAAMVVVAGSATVAAATRQVGQDINGPSREDNLGNAVAMSGNGLRIVVGAPGIDAGYAVVFDLVDGQWQQVGRPLYGQRGDRFGGAVAISADGKRVAVGGSNAYVHGTGWSTGRVEVFDYSNGGWERTGSLQGREANDEFGEDLALSRDGSTLVVGAPHRDAGEPPPGEVRVFRLNGGVWTQVGNDIDGPQEQSWFGGSVAVSANGNRIVAGAALVDVGDSFWNGNVLAYELVGNDWQQLGQTLEGKLAYFDSFGSVVAMSGSGNRIVASASGDDREGEVRIYDLVDGAWVATGTIGGASDELDGPEVAITPNGVRIAVGTPGNQDVEDGAGEVRVFENIGGEWAQVDQDINGRDFFDLLGTSVAMNANGSRVIMGAPLTDDVSFQGGSAQVFDLEQPVVICDGREATIVGTAGDDVLVGTVHADVIAGLQGNDIIRGLDGDDIICAGKGNDVVYGGDGFDIIYGAQGDDEIYAADGDSASQRVDTRGARMFGGAGDDEMHGSNRWDRMQGGPGVDRLNGYEGRDWMRGGADKDFVVGGGNVDDVHGGNGNDWIDVEGNDIVRGGAGSGDRCNIRTGAVPKPLISCELRGYPPLPKPDGVEGVDYVIVDG